MYSEKFDRPQVRSDCDKVPRPCPYVGCHYNLYIDVNAKTGSIKFNFPNAEPGDMIASCALDIAEEGGVILDEIGKSMNLTKERIRQLEEVAFNKLLKLINERSDILGELKKFPEHGIVEVQALFRDNKRILKVAETGVYR